MFLGATLGVMNIYQITLLCLLYLYVELGDQLMNNFLVSCNDLLLSTLVVQVQGVSKTSQECETARHDICHIFYTSNFSNT